MDLTTVVNQGGCSNSDAVRDYRKGNWSVQETMVLIEAKKMDEERRMRRIGAEGSAGGDRSKPAELRWKWVEDYCWRHGCLRSQNQCNDKWDNLMRDFKKVREYERRARGEEESNRSYWIIDKNERKDNNLPSNMLPEIYEALVEALDKKAQRASAASGGANVPSSAEKSPLLPSPLQQYPNNQSKPLLLPPPLSAEPPIFPFPQPSPTLGTPAPLPQLQNQSRTAAISPDPNVSRTHSDSEASEYSDSPAKRRKTVGESGGSIREIGSAIAKSGAMIADAIRSFEERGERQHREAAILHERRLQIEESNAEMNRQGINGLVDAINKLANSILALASHANQSSPK